MANDKKGFGSMSPERRSEISRLGGRAAHAAGTAHQFTTEEARAAGRKGGKASKPSQRIRAGLHSTPLDESILEE